MNIEDHILALVTKKLANAASEQELYELDELLRQHPDIHDKIKLMTEWWQSDNAQNIEANGYFRFQKIMERINANHVSVENNKELRSESEKKQKGSLVTYLTNRSSMVITFLKIAWRNALNNLVYSGINVFGLAAGMAVALLIGLWVSYQYSFDRFLPDYQQVYQVRLNYNTGTEILTDNDASLKLAQVLRDRIPEIKQVGVAHFDKHGLRNGDRKVFMQGAIVDNDFLKTLNYQLVKGDVNTIFKDPYSVVLDQSTAKALFGNDDPIGKVVNLDNRNNVKVTGIVKDVPENSSLKFNFLIPTSYTDITEGWILEGRKAGFDGNNFLLVVKLSPGVTYEQVEPKIRDIQKENPNKKYAQVLMQPISRAHLYSDYKNGKEAGGFIEYVRLFSIIGVLVLVIACINFVNLSTARSQKRAREVGVRKAIGSQRHQLVLQFLTESFLFTVIAFALCLCFVQLALSPFNALTGTTIAIPFFSVKFWLIAIGCVFFTAILAGSRPAFYLSSFNPVEVLKGKVSVNRSSEWSRKILVVTQFGCSIALIISTVVIYKQIQFAKNRPKGYDIDRLLLTDFNTDLHTNYVALRNELLQSGLVQSVTTSNSRATEHYGTGTLDNWPGKQPGETAQVAYIGISENYFHTLGIGINEGMEFDKAADSAAMILNEAAVKRLHLKGPLNQVFTFDKQRIRVKAVVKNSLMGSAFSSVNPTLYYYEPRWWTYLIYRLSPNVETHTAIEKLTKIFNKYAPSFPYSYRFADEDYNKKFQLEELVGKLSGIFATLAIFISCLGLFGLAAYVAEQRTKEIGVRKVLGASVFSLWQLMSKDFVALVFVSLLVAIPAAYYFMHHWLQGYEYHTQLSWWVFAATAVAAILITLITVSFQSIKAAMMNPVKSLRSE
ncbi:ABC transporter permease [Mucilaginibacter sp. BT774]|uniref:ABC transporter permease n=1 Tax=Mucilaginibacter sp. BT774 TaxID=3062276 RepID=UPI0026748F24|nr:ABC transporter permease [Mucilaginibacter sp. BT774]MDO3625681.1 ABC transporter permease [Mucilaginibacter sp. BT774]